MKRVGPILLFYRRDDVGDGILYSSISCLAVERVVDMLIRLALFLSTLEVQIDTTCCGAYS